MVVDRMFSGVRHTIALTTRAQIRGLATLVFVIVATAVTDAMSGLPIR